jgi:hypothetical protein
LHLSELPDSRTSFVVSFCLREGMEMMGFINRGCRLIWNF